MLTRVDVNSWMVVGGCLGRQRVDLYKGMRRNEKIKWTQ